MSPEKLAANNANAIGVKRHKPSARRAHLRTLRTGGAVSKADRLATDREVDQVRRQLAWFRDQGFTFAQMEHDLSKSGGWCNKVLRDVGRYRVTLIDVQVINASYRSAQRLYQRSRHTYAIMQDAIGHAGAIMRCMEELAAAA